MKVNYKGAVKARVNPTSLPAAVWMAPKDGKYGQVYLVASDAGHLKRVRLSDGKVFDMAKSGTPSNINEFAALMDSRYGADAWNWVDLDITATDI